MYSLNFGGKEITLETGRLAKQADGAVLVSSEGTQVLVTVCSAKTARDGQDFFPLTVDYNEKFYAAGKFLGGFMKREARPTTGETLNSRLIDRPLRPLFPEGYMNETFIQATCHSYSDKADPEVLGALGAAAALCISDVPFNTPLGTCKVGRLDGNWVVNPAFDDWEHSDIELVVSASKNAIMMVEGEAKEVSESEMLEALQFAHEQIKTFCGVIEKMVKEVGKPKRVFTPVTPNDVLMNKVEADFATDARGALSIVPKLERQNAVSAIVQKVTEAIKHGPAEFGLSDDCDAGKEAYKAVDGLLYNMMRSDILNEDKRIGSRAMDKVRPIETEVNILATPHGSALFTRGETQVMASVTMGGSEGDQMADRITGLTHSKFYLHYSFPPFSVGEARGIRAVGRRELGHGNLAERALKMALPKSGWDYTMRVFCEVLESNGSSSMGSVCSGSMALLDAGVPLTSPVAGVAMGLVKEEDKYKILTDILGDEDHLGDMDFKVAGTVDGITAIQMDIKITGITEQIFSEALEKARNARLHILGEMAKTISTPRLELKGNVPKMVSLKIAPDKIGALIGPGGKNIKGLQEKFKINIEVDEEGNVKFLGINQEDLEQAKAVVDLQIVGPKIGAEYDGKVVTIKEYGAFVDLVPGVSGLVHVSELTDARVNDVNEYLKEGDTVKVKVMDVDRFGKIKLSAKAVTPLVKRS